MSVGDDVKEAFSGKRGKVLLIGGGLAIVGYVAYTRYTGSASSDVIDPNEQTAVETDSNRVPQTDPEVGNTSSGSTSSRPDTNAGWISQGTDFLIGRGAGAGAANTALNKALEGSQLSAQEHAWVSQWIAVGGSPPDGMPPLQATPPASTTTKVTQAPGAFKVTTVTSNAANFDWIAVANSDGYRLTVVGPGKNQQYWPRFDWYATVAGLKPNSEYTASVCGRAKDGSMGPTSTIKFRTKK